MSFSEMDILIKRNSNPAEQCGVYLNVTLIWKNLIMKIDKKFFLLEKDHICLRPLRIEDIVDEYISWLSNPETIRVVIHR